MYGHHGEHHRNRNVDADVLKLKEELRKAVGVTWAQATRINANKHVATGPDRVDPPWVAVRKTMRRTGADAYHHFVQRHVQKLTPYFNWKA